jgi:hypothetical protein
MVLSTVQEKTREYQRLNSNERNLSIEELILFIGLFLFQIIVQMILKINNEIGSLKIVNRINN